MLVICLKRSKEFHLTLKRDTVAKRPPGWHLRKKFINSDIT